MRTKIRNSAVLVQTSRRGDNPQRPQRGGARSRLPSREPLPVRRAQPVSEGRLLAVLAFVWLFSPSVAAQTYRGTVRGQVNDSSGSVIPGATVAAKKTATGVSRNATTDNEGGFIIPELPAGEYEVAVEAKGFAPVIQKVQVRVGADTTADFVLATVAALRQSVTVTGTPTLVDTARDVLGEVVENRLVAQLPLNGRDFGKLVALVPGVTVEASGVAGTEKGFGQFNINGNRDRSNNYTLDGTDNNDPYFNNSALNQTGISGAPASLLPIDAIQEFNLQSQFGAEYGRNSGSVINTLTKSGTNRFHGSLFEFLRNDVLDARNFFNPAPNPKTAFRNNQFGASLGGPLVTNHTFFFAAFEGQRERVGSNFILQVPTAADRSAAQSVALANGISAINPGLDRILDFFPSSSSRSLAATVTDKNDLDSFLVKIDHQLSSSRSLSGRYVISRSQQIFPLGGLGGFGNGSRLGQFAQTSPTRVQVMSLSFLSTFSASRVNEIRFGYSRYRTSFSSLDAKLDPSSLGLNLGTGKLGLPEFDFSGVLDNLGATAFSIPRGRVSQSFQLLDNYTWLKGRHQWKFGGEVRRATVDSFNDNLERGLFSFSPSGLASDPVVDVLANFYLGNAFLTADTGNTQRTTYNNGLSFFAQDDYKTRSNLTLNAGLRWEYFGPLSEKRNLLSNLTSLGTLAMIGTQGLDGAYRRDLNNFSPRVGFAWNLKRRTVVRAAYGVYFDYIPQDLLIANFTSSAGIATNPIGPSPVFPLSFNSTAFNGSSPGSILTAQTSGAFNVFVTDRNLETPYVQSWNLNIQQQVGKAVAFEAGYVGSKGIKLVRLYDRNQTDAHGNFPNPNFLSVDVFSSGSSSTYHAVQLISRMQAWHGLSGFAAYTFSKSLDDASDGIDFNFASAALPQDSTNLRAEHGPSTFDTRQRFTSAFNYQVPLWSALPRRLGEGWQLNTIVSAQTGRPIPIVTSNDTSGRFNFHQRPNLLPGISPILPNWKPDTGYLNPLAFQQPANGTFGSLGRNAIFGPGFWDVDFSISKTSKLSENLAVQFRAEFFNIFNHPNFALPNGTIVPGVNADGSINTGAGPAGLITQTPDVAQGNPGLGGGGPRVIQFALRFSF